MYATEVLKQEHRVIERIIPVMEEAANRLANGGNLSEDTFPRILDFMRVFADRCHHAKEEDVLFPVLEKNGVDTEGGLIGALKDEHAEARSLVKKITEALNGHDGEAAEEIRAAVHIYADLLRMHIEKEDITLFPLTDRTLSAQQQMQLAVIFEDLEDEAPCQGAYDHYRQVVADLETELGT